MEKLIYKFKNIPENFAFMALSVLDKGVLFLLVWILAFTEGDAAVAFYGLFMPAVVLAIKPVQAGFGNYVIRNAWDIKIKNFMFPGLIVTFLYGPISYY